MLQEITQGKLAVKNQQGLYIIALEEIVFMEKELRKIHIHTREQEIVCYGKFSDLVPYLDERFLCCHRSYIFNMDAIVIMTDRQVFLNGNYRIFLGRDTFAKAKRQFRAYLQKKHLILS